MNMKLIINKVQRILKKPPHIIAMRVWQELYVHLEKYSAPTKAKNWNLTKLLQENKCASLAQLWDTLGKRTFLGLTPESLNLEKIPPENLAYIREAADKALQRKVSLLGTGSIELGTPIDWLKDYKSDKRWPAEFFKSIEYNNLELPSDVKIPWEISRLQWLIPAGQMYLLTKEEQYAEAAKSILLEWIEQNPYAYSVNWSCTMEVAIRIIVWNWLFFAFWQSQAWQDSDFQARFLTTLYLHGDFTQNHLEKSSVNGNHYITDAAGLVFAGMFFADSERGQSWQDLGWKILNSEIDLQISADGADYEGSIPYHRLVTEIFFLPALLRLKNNLPVPDNYRQHLLNMANFIAHYSRPDGGVPLLGDADDGRLLPFGEQDLNDHRYLIGLIALAFNEQNIGTFFAGSIGEIFWFFGDHGVQHLNQISKEQPGSQNFAAAGYYVMRNASDHIFIDCAPVGLGGNGGHGHNDCLSFEAMLENELLIVDSGAYVYTASPVARNQFRSTAAHNTPLIDNVEINRFIAPTLLWTLHYDAKPHLFYWGTDAESSIFYGGHDGYLKLNSPVKIRRIICLNHTLHSLVILDYFESTGQHTFHSPLHFLPGIVLEQVAQNLFSAKTKNHQNSFQIYFSSEISFSASVRPSQFSPAYGLMEDNQILSISGTIQAGIQCFATGIISNRYALETLQNEVLRVKRLALFEG